MKILITALIFSLSVILTACGVQSLDNGYNANDVRASVSDDDIAPVSMTSYTKSDYTVYIRQDGYAPMRLEPDDGCYIGSYVLANGNIDYSMDSFDRLTEKRHAISVYNMKLGENYPYEWVLECVASMKTPYIFVRPPNEYSVFQEDKLMLAAKDFGSVSAPVFMDFYPNPQSYTRSPEVYVNFYRKTKEIFAEHAPNVTFVLSADSSNVYDFNLYYPGDEYVDWIGISMYQPLYVNDSVNLRNYMKDLDYLYQLYQREKPIIVSQLAISSYSTFDHRYVSQDAAKKLDMFYDDIKNKYTRVKAVNYIDFNNTQGAPKNAIRDNFSITQDETMLLAYQDAVKDNYFLSETNEEADSKSELFMSACIVFEDENFKYVPESALEAAGIAAGEIDSAFAGGEAYYSTEQLSKSDGLSCVVDNERKHIIIEKK